MMSGSRRALTRTRKERFSRPLRQALVCDCRAVRQPAEILASRAMKSLMQANQIMHRSLYEFPM